MDRTTRHQHLPDLLLLREHPPLVPCGQCSELLCEKYDQVKDPAIPDQDLLKINRERKSELQNRAKQVYKPEPD